MFSHRPVSWAIAGFGALHIGPNLSHRSGPAENEHSGSFERGKKHIRLCYNITQGYTQKSVCVHTWVGGVRAGRQALSTGMELCVQPATASSLNTAKEGQQFLCPVCPLGARCCAHAVLLESLKQLYKVLLRPFIDKETDAGNVFIGSGGLNIEARTAWPHSTTHSLTALGPGRLNSREQRRHAPSRFWRESFLVSS